jgi:DNA-binding transcriptional LysR family regulator
MKIDRTDLRGVDLNLLLAFEALFQTRSVTRAAERLRIGQPAASHALKRLRTLLNDPLFVRTPTGMVPTARALELASPIRAILTDIETTLFARPTFVAREERRNFRVGATDYAQLVVLTPLMSELLSVAPDCRLIISQTSCDTVARELERGEIDLAVGVFPDATAAPHKQVLFREEYVCLYDAAASGLAAPLSLADWLALPHMMMSTRADYAGPIDDALGLSGESRFVALSTPNFLTIPFMLKNSRAVAAMPSRLARQCAASNELDVCALPIDAPSFEVAMLWHARSDGDPGAVWFRDSVMRLARQA